jgi:pilus assembly protein CpaE
VDFLRQLYAYVVIDVSGHLNDIAIAAIDLSDAIVLLTTQDIPAIKNARLFLDILQTLGVSRDRIVFTMNRYDKRIQQVTPERVSENLRKWRRSFRWMIAPPLVQ